MLNAFYAYKGDLVSAERLAREASEIEINTLKKPIGKQDHYIAAYGDLRKFTFKKDETVVVQRLDISLEARRILNANLMLFFTNRTRSSVKILSEQRHNIPNRVDILRQMKKQVSELEQNILRGDYDRLGNSLHTGWLLKKTLANSISDPELEVMYQQALDAGAIGGKIAGAGGGGFLLLYCPPEHQEKLRKALSGYPEMPFRLERDGTKVIFNVRKETWKV